MKQMRKWPRPTRLRLCCLLQQNCRVACVRLAGQVMQGVAMYCLPVIIIYLIVDLLGAFAVASPSENTTQRPVISLQGGCIAPSSPNENIRLDVIHVTFRSKRDSYSVDARYCLFNTGETISVAVGMPKYGRPDLDEQRPKAIVRDLISFNAWVNSRKAEFVEVSNFFTDSNLRPVGGYCNETKRAETGWMTKRVTFTGNATTTIRIRYEAHYHNHHVGSGRLSDTGYYHASVGRYWKGMIKRAIFISDVTEVKGEVNNWSYRRKGVAITTFISVDEIRSWEPTSGSYYDIPGSWPHAKWRGFGTSYGFWSFGGGVKSSEAPTPCSDSYSPY